MRFSLLRWESSELLCIILDLWLVGLPSSVRFHHMMCHVSQKLKFFVPLLLIYLAHFLLTQQVHHEWVICVGWRLNRTSSTSELIGWIVLRSNSTTNLKAAQGRCSFLLYVCVKVTDVSSYCLLGFWQM